MKIFGNSNFEQFFNLFFKLSFEPNITINFSKILTEFCFIIALFTPIVVVATVVRAKVLLNSTAVTRVIGEMSILYFTAYVVGTVFKNRVKYREFILGQG